MKPDWDADSARLRRNLTALLEALADAAAQRRPVDVSSIRQWHAQMMAGLRVPDEAFVGAFRGEPGVADVHVMVGSREGVPPAEIADELRRFEQRLATALEGLDQAVAPGADLSADALNGVAWLAAWAHGEWVRIHPFGNGNGRTARILANVVLMRYGLPPAVRLRPRPDGGYGAAAAASMAGDHRPMALQVLDALRRLSL